MTVDLEDFYHYQTSGYSFTVIRLPLYLGFSFETQLYISLFITLNYICISFVSNIIAMG